MSTSFRPANPSSCYFFTLRLADKSSDMLTREVVHLRRAMRETLARHPFVIDAITVLPAMIHTIWSLPDGDDTPAKRLAMFKSRFSRMMPMPANRTLTQIKRGEKGIWQRHHWQHHIEDEADYERHRDLIYLSPVHAGLCPKPQDWTHTSLHRDLRAGSRPTPSLKTNVVRTHPVQTETAATGDVLLDV